jgi:hypothetical protein
MLVAAPSPEDQRAEPEANQLGKALGDPLGSAGDEAMGRLPALDDMAERLDQTFLSSHSDQRATRKRPELVPFLLNGPKRALRPGLSGVGLSGSGCSVTKRLHLIRYTALAIMARSGGRDALFFLTSLRFDRRTVLSRSSPSKICRVGPSR